MAYMNLKALVAKIAETEAKAEHFRALAEAATSIGDRAHCALQADDHVRMVGHLQRIVEIHEEDRIARQIKRQEKLDKLIFGLELFLNPVTRPRSLSTKRTIEGLNYTEGRAPAGRALSFIAQTPPIDALRDNPMSPSGDISA